MNLNYIDRNLKQDDINLINSLFIRYEADFIIIHDPYTLTGSYLVFGPY